MRLLRDIADEALRGLDGLYAALIAGAFTIGVAIVCWDLWERLG